MPFTPEPPWYRVECVGNATARAAPRAVLTIAVPSRDACERSLPVIRALAWWCPYEHVVAEVRCTFCNQGGLNWGRLPEQLPGARPGVLAHVGCATDHGRDEAQHHEMTREEYDPGDDREPPEPPDYRDVIEAWENAGEPSSY